VAFDVFMVATKDWSPFQRYFRRCMIMAIIGVLFPQNIANYAAHLLEADGYSKKDALKAVKRFLWREPGIFGRGCLVQARLPPLGSRQPCFGKNLARRVRRRPHACARARLSNAARPAHRQATQGRSLNWARGSTWKTQIGAV
jgi:hypothetical protein